MKKIKNLFATRKKAIVTSVCLLGGLGIIGAGSVVAVGAAARSNSIGKITAENIALADAGVELAQARIARTEFDFENGNYLYEVEFAANGAKYDYRIKASDGTILERESNLMGDLRGSEPGGQPSAANTAANSAGSVIPAASDTAISLDTAKERALADAGLKEADVTYTKGQLDSDDGISIYDIEFYAADREYEYEINATSGAVHKKSSEAFSVDGVAQATAKAPVKDNTAPAADNTNTGANISVDDAKSTAVTHAGLSLSDVTFSKTKLENDDGYTEYEIEFYAGTIEYDYTIDAASGVILEYDIDSIHD